MYKLYNLTERPWIWTTNGREVSLEKALVNAQEIGGLQGSTAMMVAAQYRILLAVLHRAIDGPRSVDQWVDIWERGQFPAEAIKDYLGTWRDRFDLYGNLENPGFFQASAAIPVRERDVNKMVMDARAGGNVCLFGDGKPMKLDPGRAARNLVTIQAFALGGGASGLPKRNFVDGPCARGIVFLLVGANLFETLMLNLLPYPQTGARKAEGGSLGSDKPVWERVYAFDRDPLERERSHWSPLGLTDLYTWPSRRIVLIPAENSLQAATMMFSCGLYLGPYRDPQQYYPRKRALRLSVNNSKGPETTVFDVAPAVLDEEHRIAAVLWIERLRESGCAVEPRQVAAFGLASNLGAVLEERAIIFPYPAQGCDEEVARDGLAATKKAEGKLWAALAQANAVRANGLVQETDLSNVAIPPGWRGDYRRRLQRSFCDLIGGDIDNTMYLQRVADAASTTYESATASYPAISICNGEHLLQGGLRKAGIIAAAKAKNDKNNQKED